MPDRETADRMDPEHSTSGRRMADGPGAGEGDTRGESLGEKEVPEVGPAASATVDRPGVSTSARRRPLMALFDQIGIGDELDAARVNVYGRAEASYTFNFDDPALDFNAGRVFDVEHDEPTLNQVDLNIERVVDLDPNNWDVGGRLELLYGGDARFTHAHGLLDHHEDDDTIDIVPGPENQFDLVQAYVDLAVPVGTGLRIRAGKFLFFKQIDPNASVFYSHSFTFGGALPFTLTGVTGYYELNDRWSVEAGINRGWDQATQDNNDNISFMGRVRYTPGDRTSMALMFITGPELDDNNGAYRTAVDFIASHRLSDELTLLLDVVYGHQHDFDGSDDADWYGVAGYAVYRLNRQLSLGGRLEVFRDEDGFAEVTGVSQTLFEATAGVTITPFPDDVIGSNIKVRPEIRYDRSSEDFFDGLTEKDQVTAAVDVIFNY